MKDLLDAALSAYRHGKNEALRIGAAASGREFDRLLEEAIASRVPVTERLMLRVSSLARVRALHAARAGQLEVCEQALAESTDILRSAELSLFGRLVATSFHEAVSAYLAYRRGDYEGARQHVAAALGLDAVLIETHGVTVLDLHRLQLGHNLVRTDARAGESLRAMQTSASLLSAMEDSTEEGPLPPVRSPGFTALPPELLRAMFIQIASEPALILAGRDRGEAARLFAPLAEHAAGKATRGCGDHALAHRYLRAKAAFLDGAGEAFFEQVAALLGGGPGEAPLLWRAAARDLHDACVARGEPGAAEIAADSAGWREPSLRVRAA